MNPFQAIKGLIWQREELNGQLWGGFGYMMMDALDDNGRIGLLTSGWFLMPVGLWWTVMAHDNVMHGRELANILTSNYQQNFHFGKRMYINQQTGVIK